MGEAEDAGFKVRFSNENNTVGFVEASKPDIEDSKTTRVDTDLLKEALGLVDEIGHKSVKDIHVIDTGGEARHLYITKEGEPETGVFICGKTGYPKSAFSSNFKDDGDTE